MQIAVDFDGTCVEHRYPDVGPEVPGAVTSLRRFVALGAQLILWTMRSRDSHDGDTLAQAEAWFSKHGIPLFGVNENPGQRSWSSSPKAYAVIYIDDAAFGCPLKENIRVGGRPYVDWSVVGPDVELLIQRYREDREQMTRVMDKTDSISQAFVTESAGLDEDQLGSQPDVTDVAVSKGGIEIRRCRVDTDNVYFFVPADRPLLAPVDQKQQTDDKPQSFKVAVQQLLAESPFPADATVEQQLEWWNTQLPRINEKLRLAHYSQALFAETAESRQFVDEAVKMLDAAKAAKLATTPVSIAGHDAEGAKPTGLARKA